MANGEKLDALDRVVESAGGVAVLIGGVIFFVKVVLPLFESLIP